MAQARPQAAHQVKYDKFKPAQIIFDVIAEYPQEQHVAQQVPQGAVHEHGCKESKKGGCIPIDQGPSGITVLIADQLVADGIGNIFEMGNLPGDHGTF